MSETWPEFAALQGAHGETYAGLRDRLLADPRTPARVAGLAGDPDLSRRIHAEIVDGWLAHGPLYREVLARIDSIDVAHVRRTIGGFPGVSNGYAERARSEYKQAILPLCWEALLKFGAVWPAWKLMIFQWMISAVPSEASIEPVLEYMQEVAPLDELDSSVNTLRELPGPAVQAALARRIAALAAAIAARDGAIDPRSAALLHLWRMLRDEAALEPG